jgi:hypothetical protein
MSHIAATTATTAKYAITLLLGISIGITLGSRPFDPGSGSGQALTTRHDPAATKTVQPDRVTAASRAATWTPNTPYRQPLGTTPGPFPQTDGPQPETEALDRNLEIQSEATNLMASMKAEGLPAEDIEAIREAAASQSESALVRQSPLDELAGTMTTAEMRADLRKSLAETGASQMDIEAMTGMLFGFDQTDEELPPEPPEHP